MQSTTVKDWMKDLVVFISPDATVKEGLATMTLDILASYWSDAAHQLPASSQQYVYVGAGIALAFVAAARGYKCVIVMAQFSVTKTVLPPPKP